MKTLGRILVRKDKICGLFVPFRDSTLKEGIYSVDEFLDEILLRYVGIPHMHEDRLNGLDVSELHDELCLCMMTTEELEEASVKEEV